MSLPEAIARARATVLVLSAILLLAGAAGAQSLPGLPGAKPAATPSPTPAPALEPAPEAPDSPRAWPDVVVARLAALGASSLDVEVLCWLQTSDFASFRDFRQEALLGIMRIVGEAGTSLAFPTQTVQVVGAGGTSPAPPRDAAGQRIE
jgi:small-conductance mechanosensitive channel